MKKGVYNIIVNENEQSADVLLYGIIGQQPSLYDYEKRGEKNEDLTALEIVRTIKRLEKSYNRINIRINSPGGYIYDGDPVTSCIMNSTADIHTYNDGLAASQAANIFIAVPIENRHKALNAKTMFHNASELIYGNAKQLREVADKLDKYDEAMVATLANQLGKPKEEVKAEFFTYSDKWLTRDDAVEAGLILNEDKYESQSAPPNNLAEMTFDQLMDYYDQNEDKKATGLLNQLKNMWARSFGAVAASVSKPPSSTNNKIDSKMNLEELKTAVQNGEISNEEMASLLTEANYKVEKPEDPQQAAITAAVTAALKPLQEQIAAQQETITSLQDGIQQIGNAPGGKPSTPVAKKDPKEPLTPAEQEMNALNEQFKQAGAKMESMRIL